MDRIIFVTNNQNKVEEIKSIVGDLFDVVSLREAGIDIEIPEPYGTLEANASEKSLTVFKLTGKDCFSEDTGLETQALSGQPGVKSARYAGEGKNFRDNINKLLSALDGIENRMARFRTVISLIIAGKEQMFSGICEGQITDHPKGDKGFGYDSVFIPNGSNKTFAQMELEEKNRFSHRKKAIEQLVGFLLDDQYKISNSKNF